MYPPHAEYGDNDTLLKDRVASAPPPTRYRLRPVEFDVRQLPVDQAGCIEDICSWCGGKVEYIDGAACIRVDTPGPFSVALPGDYILKQHHSRTVFVVRQKDFNTNYERVHGYR